MSREEFLKLLDEYGIWDWVEKFDYQRSDANYMIYDSSGAWALTNTKEGVLWGLGMWLISHANLEDIAEEDDRLRVVQL